MRDDRERELRDDQEGPEQSEERTAGAPGGARQNVRRDTEQGGVARPGGATQNSGGALLGSEMESGHGPGRGAD